VQLGRRSYVVLAEEGTEKHPFEPDAIVVEPATDTEAVTMQAFVATEMRETFVEVLEADAD
jgi:hypothetical protein